MLMDIFLIALAFVWLIFASLQDLKKNEIANWLSFSLVIIALLYKGIYSIVFSQPLFFLYGLLGFFVFFILSNLLYYARFFAGGDAKLLIGLGAVLPYSTSFYSNINISLVFLFLIFLVGAAYTLIFSFFLIRKGFFSKLKENYRKYRGIFNIIFLFSLLLLVIGVLYSSLLVFLAFLVFVFPFLYMYTKSVEGGMIKAVSSSELTEGDWLVSDIMVKGKTIKSSWEGLKKEDLILLRNYRKKIKIKHGIPFVPVFLISFLILLCLIKNFSILSLFF